MQIIDIETRLQAIHDLLNRLGFSWDGYRFITQHPVALAQHFRDIQKPQTNNNDTFNTVIDEFYSKQEFRDKLIKMIKEWERNQG